MWRRAMRGLWLRGPYLHNGSVPTLRALLDPPSERPSSFYRGSDLIDPGNGGFVSAAGSGRRTLRHGSTTRTARQREWRPRLGHDLPATDKEDLLAYLKTL